MCSHEQFICESRIARLTESETSTIVTGYYADIKIKCKQCDQPFEFVGLEGGLSPFGPRVSLDSTELRAPIKPSTGKLIFESNSKCN